MPARAVSIRRRILVAATGLLLLAALALVAFIGDYAARASDRAFDRLLAASALTIAGAVQLEEGTVTVELPLASFAMFSGQDRIFYSVKAPSGAEVTGYGDLAGALPPAADDDAVFADLAYRGEPVRVASVGRLVSTADGTGWVTIRVAETRGERDALAREIFGNAIVPVLAMTALALGLLWFGIGRVFAPLLSLERHLRSRSPDNLAPVDLPAPLEVAQLVGALNGFMARLATARERLESLVAEAAHEVRTPLASLRAQAEVARGERDVAALRRQVERIHDGAVQASQLVTQLLMDATISHRLETRAASAPTSLAAALREVVQRLDPDLADRVTLQADPAAADLRLDADRVVLREMLRNLVDNALRYSDGPVDLDVATTPGGLVEIRVGDRGPGISDAERPLVFERFRRGAASAGIAGSGLGLPIVARVVAAQGGTIALEDRPGGGLTVRLRLPLSAEPAERRARPMAAALGILAVVLAGAISPPTPAHAAETFYPAPDGTPREVLHIAGTTDTPLFAPLAQGFQRTRPDVAIAYEEGDTLPIFERFVAGGSPVPDILMSSAADLQVKLVNDGHARRYASPAVAAIPPWATWRSEVFGFSFEPAVIVYNTASLAESEVPRTHLELAELLEREASRFRGRVATYDVARSGVGYLLAAQDQAISSYFWRLASAFGRTDVRLSGSSPAILDGLATGEFAIGYNILGSYAFARQQAGAPIGIVVPDDYVLVLTRSMLIPQGAPRPDLAEAFLDFTLSPAGQSILAGAAALGSVVPGSAGRWTSESIAALGRGAVQPIALSPSLLVGLDRQRRARFLDTWHEIVSPRVPDPPGADAPPVRP
ncbi:extracellular solute-binding protein [Aureimonas sp. AU12]|uniref:sensor histidine kinase n=1 Tax=Aureimonas sp. AU12 TaxID=1638161 RepID=UPI0007806F46|nr:extracellular solute-binding protein [Aureimonas sp. AU12]